MDYQIKLSERAFKEVHDLKTMRRMLVKLFPGEETFLWYLDAAKDYLYVRSEQPPKEKFDYYFETLTTLEIPIIKQVKTRLDFRLKLYSTHEIIDPDYTKKMMPKEPEEAVADLRYLGNTCGYVLEAKKEINAGFDRGHGKKGPFRAWYREYQGILSVTDCKKFNLAVQTGIGEGQEYGMGLLHFSVVIKPPLNNTQNPKNTAREG